MQHKANGFTILELLAVMMIAATLVMLAVPRIDFVSMEMNASGRAVMMTLLKAQRQAIMQQHAVVVAFDTANRRLRVHSDTDNDGTIDGNEIVNYVQLEGAAVFSRGSAPALGFGAAAVNLAKQQGGLPAVTFTRAGSASENGGLYLTSRRDAGAGGRPNHGRAFEIDRATGRTFLFQHDGAWRSLY